MDIDEIDEETFVLILVVKTEELELGGALHWRFISRGV